MPPQFYGMENEHIVSGLLRKRADIAGEIAVLHDKLRAQQADLAHVESTLKLFQPDIDFSGARVSRKPGAQSAGYGGMSRAVRDALRDAADWMTLRALQENVMTARGMDLEDSALCAVVRKRIAGALRNLKRRGQAEDRHGVGLAMEWRLQERLPKDDQAAKTV